MWGSPKVAAPMLRGWEGPALSPTMAGGDGCKVMMGAELGVGIALRSSAPGSGDYVPLLSHVPCPHHSAVSFVFIVHVPCLLAQLSPVSPSPSHVPRPHHSMSHVPITPCPTSPSLHVPCPHHSMSHVLITPCPMSPPLSCVPCLSLGHVPHPHHSMSHVPTT